MARVFLSHATLDSPLALLIKATIEANVSGTEVFCSSDPTDLPLGTLWPRKVQEALRDSDILFVLATSRSLPRPWVWFECGTLWFTGKAIVPLCVGQVRANALPTPLSERQGLNIDDAEGFDNLVKMLERVAGAHRATLDVNAVATQLRALDRDALVANSRNAGWLGVAWGGRFLAYDGPLEGMRLIEDRPFEHSMATALDEHGFTARMGDSNRLAHNADVGYRIIYLTDQATWRQKLTDGMAVLLARPQMPQ